MTGRADFPALVDLVGERLAKEVNEGAGVVSRNSMEVGVRGADRSLSRSDDVLTWLAARRARPGFAVERIPFVECKEWRFDDGWLAHVTGWFFSVIGLSARSRFPGLEAWEQPIIDQPEVGIRGFLAQRRRGAWHLLVQANVEPGTCVHGGRRPPYLDFFLGADAAAVLVDQLQSEQGSRFFRTQRRGPAATF